MWAGFLVRAVAPIASSFLGAKLPERKADKSSPSSAEVNARSFTSVLTYIFMAWCSSTKQFYFLALSFTRRWISKWGYFEAVSGSQYLFFLITTVETVQFVFERQLLCYWMTPYPAQPRYQKFVLRVRPCSTSPFHMAWGETIFCRLTRKHKMHVSFKQLHVFLHLSTPCVGNKSELVSICLCALAVTDSSVTMPVPTSIILILVSITVDRVRWWV